MSIYLTSDEHFGHKNIIRLDNRPFASLQEMEDTLIANWNGCVKRDDQVYILGDFSFGKGEYTNSILRRLNGRKFLVRGNHDYFLKDKEFDKSLFEWVKDYYVLRTHIVDVVMSHYPFLVWDKQDYGSINAYGHLHSASHRLPVILPNAFNVGVDVNNFMPVLLDTLLNKRILKQEE